MHDSILSFSQIFVPKDRNELFQFGIEVLEVVREGGVLPVSAGQRRIAGQRRHHTTWQVWCCGFSVSCSAETRCQALKSF